MNLVAYHVVESVRAMTHRVFAKRDQGFLSSATRITLSEDRQRRTF